MRYCTATLTELPMLLLNAEPVFTASMAAASGIWMCAAMGVSSVTLGVVRCIIVAAAKAAADAAAAPYEKPELLGGAMHHLTEHLRLDPGTSKKTQVIEWLQRPHAYAVFGP
jgi:hypothetical protein